MAIEIVGTPVTAGGIGDSITLSVPAGVRAGDLLIASATFASQLYRNAPAGWELGGQARAPQGSPDGRLCIGEWWWRIAGDDEPASYTWTRTGIGAGGYYAGGMLALRGVDPEAWLHAHESVIDETGASASITAPSVETTVPGCLVLSLFWATASAYTSGLWTEIAGLETLWRRRGTSNVSSHAAFAEWDAPVGPTSPRTSSSSGSNNARGAFTIAIAPAPTLPTQVAGRLQLTVGASGAVSQAHQIGGRLRAITHLTGGVELPIFVAGRLQLGPDLRGWVDLSTQIGGRLQLGPALSAGVTQDHQIAGRLGAVVDLQGDLLIPTQVAGRLQLGPALHGAIQSPTQIAGRLQLLTGLSGAVMQPTVIAGRLQLRLGLRDGYTGPGTGIVTPLPDEAAWLSSLREGDTFRIVIPSGIPFGRTALARVLGRAVDAQGRLSLTLQLDDWPTASRLVIQDTVTVARYQPAEALDLARRTVEAGRAIERLERERD